MMTSQSDGNVLEKKNKVTGMLFSAITVVQSVKCV